MPRAAPLHAESAVALLVSFFINLAIVATNFANFYAPKCAEATGGPFACVSLAAYNASAVAGGGNEPLPSTGDSEAENVTVDSRTSRTPSLSSEPRALVGGALIG